MQTNLGWVVIGKWERAFANAWSLVQISFTFLSHGDFIQTPISKLE